MEEGWETKSEELWQEKRRREGRRIMVKGIKLKKLYKKKEGIRNVTNLGL